MYAHVDIHKHTRCGALNARHDALMQLHRRGYRQHQQQVPERAVKIAIAAPISSQITQLLYRLTDRRRIAPPAVSIAGHVAACCCEKCHMHVWPREPDPVTL